ncbi:MAG TPA: hypothetical protein VMB52_01990 [Verrucomicrobiae bacterium]|nr:hypothetical protein [Verrucomicrobiae bacterium]
MILSIAILPGIVSGKQTTRQIQTLLRQAGYRVVKDPAEADIVLAHSAGCLWLPMVASQDQILVLVNPPYWPGRTVRERIRDRSRSNAQFYTYDIPLLAWITRQCRGVYYAVRNPLRTRYILQNIASYDLRETVRGKRRIIVVRNRHDDWLTPDLAELPQLNPNLMLVHIPGEHDDFNYHPQRYVRLLAAIISNERRGKM